jgi:hypothetical protein
MGTVLHFRTIRPHSGCLKARSFQPPMWDSPPGPLFNSSSRRLVWSVIPSLVAWPAVALPPLLATPALAAALLLVRHRRLASLGFESGPGGLTRERLGC